MTVGVLRVICLQSRVSNFILRGFSKEKAPENLFMDGRDVMEMDINHTVCLYVPARCACLML